MLSREHDGPAETATLESRDLNRLTSTWLVKEPSSNFSSPLANQPLYFFSLRSAGALKNLPENCLTLFLRLCYIL